jgi:hypothetical protein
MLGAALKASQSLLLIDISFNSLFDDNLEYHTEITDCLINAPGNKLRKIKMTTTSVAIKTHYIELKDQRPDIIIYNNGNIL